MEGESRVAELGKTLENDRAYLGIDLGGTEIKAVTLTPGGDILWTCNLPTRAAEGRDAVLERLTRLVRDAVEAAPAPICAVGLAFPGVIDMETGCVEKIANLTTDWNGFLLRDVMVQRIDLPTFVLNDVRAATVAEQTWGAGRAYRDFICLAIGTGIGGGLVLSRQLFTGSRGAAGELGHQTAVPDGLMCGCGNRGCLETVASGPALSRAARTLIDAGDVELQASTGSDEPTPRQLAGAAERGNEAARAIFAQAGEHIGVILANLVCALNPEAIVIGGGVAEAGNLLLDPIRQEIARRTVVFSPERGGVTVLHAQLGPQAGAIGAAGWAMRQIMRMEA